MHLTPEQIQQTCGILLCTDFNTFIYYCTKCRCEFGSGKELEEHIVFDHHDEKLFVDGIYADDGIVLDATPPKTTMIVQTETIPSAIADQVTEPLPKSANVDVNSGEEVQYELQNEESTRCSTNDNTKCEESNQATPEVDGKPQKGSYYCDMCPGRTFRTLDIIRAHMKRHVENKLRKPCPLCPIRPKNYEKHMQYVHTEAKPYKCDFCAASFKTNMARVVHMRTHTGERPYLCATCGQSFTSEDTRKKHNTRVHSAQMPHPCSKCDRRFITPSQLLQHIYAFHSSERPYTCEICGHSYATRRNLRKHHKSHGEKTHLCNYCGAMFKTTETRRWHLRKVHKILKN